jgi:hypothetical protein
MSSKIKVEKIKPLIPPKAKRVNIPKIENNIFPKWSEKEVEKLKREKMLFSFTFLDLSHPSFNCGSTKVTWFMDLYRNMSEISRLNLFEFWQQRQHYDVHRHDFTKTAHNYNESISETTLEQISPENMVQFRLSSSGGRVHGILYHNTFYVLWLDPHHNMNPDDRYGGARFFESPVTEFDMLLHEKEELLKKNKRLEEDNLALLEEVIRKDKELELLNSK